MRTLDLSSVDEVSARCIDALAKGCPRLSYLRLAFCSSSDTLRSLQQLSQLTALDLSNAEVPAGHLVPLLEPLTRLEFLSLSHCTDPQPEEFSALGALRHLKWVSLAKTSVDDKALCGVLPALPSLQSLDVRYCKGVSDVTLECVSLHNPHLTTLRIGFTGGVSDTGLSALARGCTCLRVLDLSDCRRVTDVGLGAVLRALPLKYCCVYGCHNVTESSLELAQPGVMDGNMARVVEA